MKKGVSLKQLLVICIIIVVSAYGIYHVTYNWGLMSKSEAITVARKWLHNPSWVPAETHTQDYVCKCGRKVYTYMLSDRAEAKTGDMVQVDRKEGAVVSWWRSPDYCVSNSRAPHWDPTKAYEKWAPAHLNAALRNKLHKYSSYTWMYRQKNGIWIPSTSVNFDVSDKGEVCNADIQNCHLSDYKGVVSVSPDQALDTVKQWIMLQYPQGTYEFY